MHPVHVFFFRGLSTYGEDRAKWSVFDFGPLPQHIERALTKRGIVFHPVLGMGAGPLSESARRARAYIESHPAWRTPGQPVHFLGHSAGGLVARLVLAALESEPGQHAEIRSCLTVATPHSGARLAQIACEMPERHRGSARVLRGFGYDLKSKRDFFSELTSDGVARVLAALTSPARADAASIVCAAPRESWCRPLRLFHTLKAFRDFDLPSDGVVERVSQPFGHVEAEIALDHFRQVGLFGERERFEQMCAVISGYFARQQKS